MGILKKTLYTNREVLFPFYKIRPMIDFVRKNYHITFNLVGVEIGVSKGNNAISILKRLHIKRFFLVDSFKQYGGYLDTFNCPKNFKCLTKRLLEYDDKTVLINDFSHIAVKTFPDNFFDFVYIDANHEYKYIKQDIKLWYPKVKHKGIFGGHDYNSYESGVVSAVKEFIDKTGLDLFFYRDDWWVIKNDNNNRFKNR